MGSLEGGCIRFVPICSDASDLFRFLAILLRFLFRTNKGNPFLPTTFASPRNRFRGDLVAISLNIGADFWEGDATKHFSVKKRVFSVKGGRQFSEWGVW